MTLTMYRIVLREITEYFSQTDLKCDLERLFSKSRHVVSISLIETRRFIHVLLDGHEVSFRRAVVRQRRPR